MRASGGVGQSAGERLQIYICLFLRWAVEAPTDQSLQTGVRQRAAGHFGGMHPSSTSTTPFSVKDILNLEHNKFANKFLMADQDTPVHYQHVHGAPRDRGHCHLQPKPFVSGMPEKLDGHMCATEEEINEHGENLCHNPSVTHLRRQ